MAFPAGSKLDIKSSSAARTGDTANDFTRNRRGGISAPFNQGIKTEFVIGGAVIVLVAWLFLRSKK